MGPAEFLRARHLLAQLPRLQLASAGHARLPLALLAQPTPFQSVQLLLFRGARPPLLLLALFEPWSCDLTCGRTSLVCSWQACLASFQLTAFSQSCSQRPSSCGWLSVAALGPSPWAFFSTEKDSCAKIDRQSEIRSYLAGPFYCQRARSINEPIHALLPPQLSQLRRTLHCYSRLELLGPRWVHLGPPRSRLSRQNGTRT